MLAGGGMGRRAFRVLWEGAGFAGETMDGTACCMMAGVSGSTGIPASVTVGIMRSCVASFWVAGVLRLARISMTVSLTTEYGRGCDGCRDAASTIIGVRCPKLWVQGI